MKKTIVDIAKNFRVGGAYQANNVDMKLITALLKGELRYSQVQKAYGRKRDYNLYPKIVAVVKRLIKEEKLVFTNKP